MRSIATSPTRRMGRKINFGRCFFITSSPSPASKLRDIMAKIMVREILERGRNEARSKSGSSRGPADDSSKAKSVVITKRRIILFYFILIRLMMARAIIKYPIYAPYSCQPLPCWGIISSAV